MTHEKRTQRMLIQLKKKNLFLKPEKYIFEVEIVDFLGLVILPGHIHMDLVKIKRMIAWCISTNI